MKISLIGGSGFIGTRLTDMLADAGYDISNLDKTASKKYAVLTLNTDVRDYANIARSLTSSDWVVLLAAEHHDNVSPTSLYYDVNVKGTENVLQAMNEKGIKKIVFTSSVAVYGLNQLNADETQRIAPFNDYGKSKWLAEEVLRKWYNEDSQNRTLVIIRPTVVFGPGNRGNVYNLLKQIASGKFLMIGNGENKKSMSYVDNVAGFLKYCIDNHFSGYHLYNYVDKPDLNMKELVNVAEIALNKKLPTIRIPYTLGYLGGIVFDVLSKVTRKKFPISAVRVKKFCATTQFSSEKMLTTGYRPLVSLQNGIDRTIKSITGTLK